MGASLHYSFCYHSHGLVIFMDVISSNLISIQ